MLMYMRSYFSSRKHVYHAHSPPAQSAPTLTLPLRRRQSAIQNRLPLPERAAVKAVR